MKNYQFIKYIEIESNKITNISSNNVITCFTIHNLIKNDYEKEIKINNNNETKFFRKK